MKHRHFHNAILLKAALMYDSSLIVLLPWMALKCSLLLIFIMQSSSLEIQHF